MVALEAISKAVSEVKKSPKRGFTQSIDLVVNLRNLDMNRPENRIDQEVFLPGGRGKEVRVALFAGPELAHQAKDVVDRVIEKEELEALAKDKKLAKNLVKEYNFFLAQTDLMPLVGRALGPVLGPRGKMPRPVAPNADIKPIVERLRRTVKMRTRSSLTFHLPVGTEEMEDSDLVRNISAVLELLEGRFGRGSQNVRSVYLKKTMGPCIKLEGF